MIKPLYFSDLLFESALAPGTPLGLLALHMRGMLPPWGICTDLSTWTVLLPVIGHAQLSTVYFKSAPKLPPQQGGPCLPNLKGQPNPLQHSPFYVSQTFFFPIQLGTIYSLTYL